MRTGKTPAKHLSETSPQHCKNSQHKTGTKVLTLLKKLQTYKKPPILNARVHVPNSYLLIHVLFSLAAKYKPKEEKGVGSAIKIIHVFSRRETRGKA